MRNRFLSLGVVLAVLGIFPAAAQAHHVDLNVSTVTCALVANVPTITTSIAYREFEEYNKPVHWQFSLNGAAVDSGVLTWPGPNYDHVLARPVAAGEYDVTYTTTWGYGNSATLRKHVVCPAPVPPPTTCNGVVMSPGTNCAPPPATCNGQPMAPGANCASVPPKKPPCGCKPKPRPHCIPTRARLKVFPLRRLHGEVIFTLAGVRRADVVSVHWAVHRPGHRWRHVGHSGKPWEHMAHRGLSWHIFLWVEKVWGYPQWGHHQVRARAKVKTTCGVRTITRKLTYMNSDPEPRAHNWS